MARIDQADTQPRRLSAPGTAAALPEPTSRGAQQLAASVARSGEIMQDSLLAVAGALDTARTRIERASAERRAEQDRLTLADLRTATRRDLALELDRRNDAYTGAEEGFGADWDEWQRQELDRRVASLEPRLRTEAQTALTEIGGQVSLAAWELEDARREQFLLNGVNEGAEADEALILTDPGHYPSARANIEIRAAAVPERLRADWIKEREGRAAGAYVEAMNRADPYALRGELQSNALDAELGPAGKSRALSANEAEIARREREALAEQRERERLAREARTEARAAARDIIGDIETVTRAGFPARPELVQAAMQAVGAGGDPALGARLEQALALADAGQALAMLPPAELEARRNELQAMLHAEGATAGGAALAKLADDLLSEQARAAENGEALDYYRSRGLTEVAPLDWGADNLTEQMQRRRAQAGAAGEAMGVRANVLLPQERAAIARDLREAEPDAAADLLGQIYGASGADADRIVAELGADDPEMAHVAGLYRYAPGASREALAGMRMLAGGGRLPARGAEGRGGTYGEERDAMLGGIPGLDPADREAALTAADAIYLARASRAGVAGDAFEPRLYEDAVAAALGGAAVARVNGGAFLTAPGVDPDAAAALVKQLTDADLVTFSATGGRPAYADGSPVPAEAISGRGLFNSGARLIYAGPGRYHVSLTDPAAGEELLADGETGGPWVLDLSHSGKIARRLRDGPEEIRE